MTPLGFAAAESTHFRGGNFFHQGHIFFHREPVSLVAAASSCRYASDVAATGKRLSPPA